MTTTTRMQFPTTVTTDQMIAINVKAFAWRDGKSSSTDRTLTGQEVEEILNMQGSFHSPREWVGIHVSNMIHFGRSWEAIVKDIKKQVKLYPNRKNAYTLFLKPFQA